MGRPRKPKELHDLHGNPGHRSQPAGPGLKDFGPTKAPRWLDRNAKAEWRRLGPTLERLGMLHAGTRSAFAAYCHAYSLAVRAAQQFEREREGQLTFWDGKVDKPAPEVDIQFKALESMRRFLVEFGLTPATAGKVPIITTEEDSADEAFLFGGEPKRRPAKASPSPKVEVGNFGRSSSSAAAKPKAKTPAKRKTKTTKPKAKK